MILLTKAKQHRVAVASSDGDYVDEHFGNALYYQIYDERDNDWSFIETRKVRPGCGGADGCGGLGCQLAERLSDCEAIFVLRIGETAAAGAIAAGLRVFEAAGPVDDVLTYVSEKGFLETIGAVR
jgi:predicted Fe-Mo cluster-binding NifX family protein